MYVINYKNEIVFIDVSKFHDDVELHSHVWKIMYNIEFPKQKQNLLEKAL